MSLRLSRDARSKREQIEEACRTSTDDVGISRYFHVPAYEVQAIRLAMVERDAELPVTSPCAVAAASDELRDRCEALFAKWGRRHGRQPHEAREMLVDRKLNGVPIAELIARLREAA